MGVTKSVCGMTREDKMRNEDIRRQSEVVNVLEGIETKNVGRTSNHDTIHLISVSEFIL
jgi:hypothetical protein